MMSRFVCEALVSAGKRHTDDEELCEDAVGIISSSQGAAFYIADATSDEDRIGAFSSRYLANSIGYHFLNNALDWFGGPQTQMDIDGLFSGSIDQMQTAWANEWRSFISKPEAMEMFGAKSRPFRGPSADGRLLSFSCAFAAGVILKQDRRVLIARTGDIGMMVKREGEAPRQRETLKDRIFARVVSHGDAAPQMKFSDTPYEVYKAGRMEYLILKSDGAKYVHEGLIAGALAKSGIESAKKLRRIFLKGMRSDTGDDKAVFYGMFI
ncbi:MAG: hypothetical protein HQK86_02680 [Nitrospinae bacterium]|nr:hypothetical protein [Nitrospinota bacterium]MBF0634350.1 hypothetical protein [Nitrospinota bacterium]